MSMLHGDHTGHSLALDLAKQRIMQSRSPYPTPSTALPTVWATVHQGSIGTRRRQGSKRTLILAVSMLAYLRQPPHSASLYAPDTNSHAQLSITKSKCISICTCFSTSVTLQTKNNQRHSAPLKQSNALLAFHIHPAPSLHINHAPRFPNPFHTKVLRSIPLHHREPCELHKSDAPLHHCKPLKQMNFNFLH